MRISIKDTHGNIELHTTRDLAECIKHEDEASVASRVGEYLDIPAVQRHYFQAFPAPQYLPSFSRGELSRWIGKETNAVCTVDLKRAEWKGYLGQEHALSYGGRCIVDHSRKPQWRRDGNSHDH